VVREQGPPEQVGSVMDGEAAPMPGGEVPVPGGLMPPPPEEVVEDVPKMLPEYSGQRAGEKNEFRV